jgi:uncharacterized protein (DUF2147 family)
MKRVFMCCAMILFLAAAAFASSPDDILGVWNNEEKDAKIEIFKCGEGYCGRIVWLREPDYPTGSTEGKSGTPKLDRNNPDPSLRTKPVMGLEIVRDFVFSGDGLWTKGTVYDPKNGKIYSGKMTLVSATRLDLRGFIGIPLVGRTTQWSR